MRVKKNTKYRIKTKSGWFKNKYGSETPFIMIEDTDLEVFGDSWKKRQYVPAVLAFMIRQVADDVAHLGGKDQAYYGKIFTNDKNFGIGELVFKTELEEV